MSNSNVGPGDLIQITVFEGGAPVGHYGIVSAKTPHGVFYKHRSGFWGASRLCYRVVPQADRDLIKLAQEGVL